MEEGLEKALAQIVGNRQMFVANLINYVLTDTVLFLPDNKKARDVLMVVNKLLGVEYTFAQGLNVNIANQKYEKILERYLCGLSDRQFSLSCAVAFEVRSVLLGVLFAEKKISADDVFNLAFSEELEQQKKWGTDDSTEIRHQEIRARLKQLEMQR